MPAEALQIAITTPMITAVSDPLDLALAALIAWLNTSDVPLGSALPTPLISVLTVSCPGATGWPGRSAR